jgi:flavin-dependent dehydrogenase
MDDVVIVGAGPAGSLAAIVLARAGLAVRLLDRARFPRAKLCGDTVNPGAIRVLARHLCTTSLVHRAGQIDGMLITGPGNAAVRGEYGPGIHGYAIERRTLDQILVAEAGASGARVEPECTVEEASTAGGRVTGVRVRTPRGWVAIDARMVIAADGRHSKVAFGLGLTRHPRQPRRWAIGAYFSDVEGLTGVGEMHVRRNHYIGVAPMPNGMANACVVIPYAAGQDGWRDAAAQLTMSLARDPQLKARFARSRMQNAPSVLGPMAVDAAACGVPGLLLAGDAAGFIDPMTGDGLTFAFRGAEMAAAVVRETLSGRCSFDGGPALLARRRRAAFATKCTFNRSLRRLVASPRAVGGAAIVARQWPRLFERMIRYAGDVTAA